VHAGGGASKTFPSRAISSTAAGARPLVDCGILADTIVANDVMAHGPDVNGVVEGISVLLGV
jgi:hypothetical protein